MLFGEFKDRKGRRLKELKAQGFSEEEAVNEMKREFPSIKTYSEEKKLHERYKEVQK